MPKPIECPGTPVLVHTIKVYTEGNSLPSGRRISKTKAYLEQKYKGKAEWVGNFNTIGQDKSWGMAFKVEVPLEGN